MAKLEMKMSGKKVSLIVGLTIGLLLVGYALMVQTEHIPMFMDGSVAQEKVIIVSVEVTNATKGQCLVQVGDTYSVFDKSVTITKAYLKDQTGTTLEVCTLEPAVALPVDGTIKEFIVDFTAVLTSGKYYCVCLISKRGNMFVAPPFKA